MAQHDTPANDVPEHDDGYAGEATVVVDEAELPVRIRLRGHFQPIDGYYHWYGRLEPDGRLSELLDGGKRRALIRTPRGEAEADLSDPDPWDRYRVHGTSTPPFPVPAGIEDAEA